MRGRFLLAAPIHTSGTSVQTGLQNQSGWGQHLNDVPIKRKLMPFKDPEKARISRRKCYRKNRVHYIAIQKAYRKTIQSAVREAKNKPCTDCGHSFPYYVMDFDHIREKSFTIARSVGSAGMPKTLAEIAKCEVICANCHRIRTHGRIAQQTEQLPLKESV